MQFLMFHVIFHGRKHPRWTTYQIKELYCWQVPLNPLDLDHRLNPADNPWCALGKDKTRRGPLHLAKWEARWSTEPSAFFLLNIKLGLPCLLQDRGGYLLIIGKKNITIKDGNMHCPDLNSNSSNSIKVRLVKLKVLRVGDILGLPDSPCS